MFHIEGMPVQEAFAEFSREVHADEQNVALLAGFVSAHDVLLLMAVVWKIEDTFCLQQCPKITPKRTLR